MSVLIFNGELEKRVNSTSFRLANSLKAKLEQKGELASVFNLGQWDIPLFDLAIKTIPPAVTKMAHAFREADQHIWLTPLYHGSLTGAMKNALDWLEITSTEKPAYLTNKVIGLVCWAAGTHAMQGINAMDSVAKALRAWTLPYSIPAVGSNIFDMTGSLSPEYDRKFDMMLELLTQSAEFQANYKTATLI